MTDAILEPPREAMRATDPDEAIGRNVKRLRVKCGRTIDDVVKAMQKAGYRWNATTQSNIERGARPLRASEVLPLLRCMGYSSKDELTISEHDQFGKEYEELSAHMLKLLGSIAADRFGYVSPNNGPGPAERRITCSPIRKQNI